MKKFFKALALVLALALVIGVVPAQATSAKIKAKKTLYVDGAKGTGEDGKLTSSYKNRVAIYKLAGAKKADKEDHKFTAKIKSGDSVTVSKNYVYAADLGKSVVELFKDGESLGTTVVTVKKNATADTLTITEFEDGKEVVCGVEYTVTLPRKGVDTDERRLIVDDKAVADKEDAPRAYAVKFTTAGDHKVKYEAFQGGKLTDATASKEITVKAVMPQPVSAKQVSASSFAVEFESNMEGLISKDDITNQMIYYLIASEPVVTGVIKSVEVKDKVVTVTMYANFNSDTDYYFAYGNVDPIKFHTAKNDIKYATSLKLIAADAYYVGQDTKITYKFYNADGVELNIPDIPALEVVSDNAYGIGTNIYFHTEGAATIKASIVTGYDDETNVAITLKDELAVNGVKKTATQTGKKYSFTASADDAKHSIRIGQAAAQLSIKYTLSDGTTAPVNSTDTGYYLKSTDETVAMIATGRQTVYGVNPGSATIVLYDNTDAVLDAFPITVLEGNKVGKVSIDLDKETLNLTGADTITLKVVGYDLDDEKDTTAAANYSVEIQQLENNDVATKVTWNDRNKTTKTPTTGSTTELELGALITDDDRADVKSFATVRLTVTVKDAAGATITSKTVSFVVSTQTVADRYKLVADNNALDTSVKNWKTDDIFTKKANISVWAVKTSSYGDFFISEEQFKVVSSVNNIPVTSAANDECIYVIKSYPNSNGTDLNEVDLNGGALLTGTATTITPDTDTITITAFPAGGTTRCQVGNYVFTGYHVKYDTNERGIRSSLGQQSVVVSRSDIAAAAAIVDGSADNFGKNVGTPKNIFKVTWADKNSKDHGDRVEIQPLVEGVDKNYTYDAQTKSYYCKKISVKLYINDAKTAYFFQEIAINKLFKDE